MTRHALPTLRDSLFRSAAAWACLATGAFSPAAAGWSPEFSGPGQLTGWVHALAWYRGQLVTGGETVWTEDGTILDRLGAWDGARWNAMGGGVTHGGCPGPPCWAIVRSLEVYGELLVAGGNFIRAGGQPANYVAAWNGSTWSALGSGTNGRISAVLAYGDDLYVGGEFTTAGGLPAANIARWDGNVWESVGEGLCCGFVRDLVFFEGTLVAAGNFVASGVRAGVAIWDGLAWNPIQQLSSASSVSSLSVFESSLVANGSFELWDGPFLVPYRMARWDGEMWSPIGAPTAQPYGGELAVFGGKLLSSDNQGDQGPNIHAWDGQVWAPFQSGANDAVLCMLPMDSTLYIGGRFTEAGGVPSEYVARWDAPPTPVFLQEFSATWLPQDAGVQLDWRLAQWDEIVGIEVERAPNATGPFDIISPLLPPRSQMEFVDATGVDQSERWYRLLARTRTGAVEALGTLAATPRDRPPAHALFPIFDRAPGPIAIRYALADVADTYRLAVYDVTGRLVRVLDAGRATPGDHLTTWNRESQSGRRVARNTYFVRLESGGRATARKLTLLHAR